MAKTLSIIQHLQFWSTYGSLPTWIETKVFNSQTKLDVGVCFMWGLKKHQTYHRFFEYVYIYI